jgi:tryptophan-rich sensory protein
VTFGTDGNTMDRRQLHPILVAAAAAMVVASLGAFMTDLGDWYRTLAQPAWKPPDWVFGPAWTTIFATAAAAGVQAWREAPDKTSRVWMLALFAINGFLNIAWSLLYFRLHRPDWALVEVGLLWLSVLALMLVLGRYSRKSALLLTPYLAWITVAGTLNWGTVQLNGPF